MKLKVWVKTDIVGSLIEDIIDISDEEAKRMTTDQIEEEVREWAFERIEYGYKEI